MLEDNNAQQPTTSPQGAGGAAGVAPSPAAPAPAPAPAPASIPSGAETMQGILDERQRAEQEQQQQQQQQPAQQPPAPTPDRGDQGDYQAMTPIEKQLAAAMRDDPRVRREVYELGAAILNQCPDLIEHNLDYILQTLGYDQAATDRQTAESQRAEYAHSQTMSREMNGLYREFVEKGKAAGLNDLEAAGLAAMAYEEIEGESWKADSEWARAFNDWQGRVRGGNKLHAGDGRKAAHKVFDSAYKRAAERYQHLSPTSGRGNPGAPPTRYLGRVGDAADVMRDILREQGKL
jgi:hypothetical protein